ncbi:hypothetical protein Brsp06_03417 [Brucella sp. NBRC 13694]|nr:hypothetical protein [Brucella anthropi]NIH76997.1 hypothetical protein [Ochrobactrum sp. P20RRXII]
MATFVDAGDDLIRSEPFVDLRWRPGTRLTISKICTAGICPSDRGYFWTVAYAESFAVVRRHQHGRHR